ncbi:class I SAM-dependent methyltransferase [Oxalobacteraceae bacterium]|nr:class I SAM-dependent methyltransferase [Oxalobacteraceae bacterium]
MTQAFYDDLAPYYHLLYGDWENAVREQGAALSALLRELGVASGAAIHDAACGIGTQTLGLLASGYRVSASDLSQGAVERLQGELARRELQATVFVDDLRSLDGLAANSKAAILACDNSIPHLLSDAEILASFRSCYRCLEPGGFAVISVRDYDRIERKSPDVRPYGLRYEGENRFLAVQAWEWDGDQYDVRMYLTSESAAGECSTRVLKSRYYAVSVDRLIELMREAGFAGVKRRDDVLFQPVIFGQRPELGG